MAVTRKPKKQPTTTVVTTGSTIRFEQPKSGRGRKNPVEVIVQEVNPVSGFVGFLREHAVVGLAVGFIIGQQAQGLVKLLQSTFIDPAFQVVFGEKLTTRTFMITSRGKDVPFHWGEFANGLLNFLFVLAAIYAIIKVFNLDKLDKPKEKK
jgi:large-conductance mechanosensitive channel